MLLALGNPDDYWSHNLCVILINRSYKEHLFADSLLGVCHVYIKLESLQYT